MNLGGWVERAEILDAEESGERGVQRAWVGERRTGKGRESSQ